MLPAVRHGPRRHALTGLGLASAAGYAYLAFGVETSNRPAHVVGFIALLGTLFLLHLLALAVARRTWPILFFAALFRLLLVPAGLLPGEGVSGLGRDLGRDLGGEAVAYETFLLYDNDVWRYLWDGHLSAHGIAPYAVTPAEVEERAASDPRLAPLLAEERWSDIYDQISFRRHTSVYPPGAQHFFHFLYRLAPGSVFLLKLALAGLDFLTCLLLVGLLRHLGRRPEMVLLYAWNPVVVAEIAGSGHVDGLMICLLVAALYALLRVRPHAALLLYGLSILAKLAPLALAGLFLRRTPRRAWPLLPLVLAVGCVPYYPYLGDLLDGLLTYARNWQFNGGPWLLLRTAAGHLGATAPALWANALGKGAVLALVVYTTWHGTNPDRRLVASGFAILAVLLLTNPAVMPWYLLWALPWALLAGWHAWSALTALSLLSYLYYIDDQQAAWWLWLEYGVFFVVLGVEWWLRRTRQPSDNAGSDGTEKDGAGTNGKGEDGAGTAKVFEHGAKTTKQIRDRPTS